MRKIGMAFLLTLAALCAVLPPASALDAPGFGDSLPLPPPALDDEAPAPPPLTVDNLPPLPPPLGSSAPGLPPPATSSAFSPPGSSVVAPISLPSAVGATPATPGAPAAPGVPQIAAIPADETPRQGKISGGRVNVRAGPNTQYESIAVLSTGSPVTILARNGEWYKIIYPADQLASIHRNFVDADITGEIPEAGVPGVVNQDNADIHAFYWDKSTVVGKLNKGDPVVIKQERGQWYRIAAPESARAFVFADYVKLDGQGAVAVDAAPPPDNPSVDLAVGKQDATGRLKLSENDRKAAALKEAYFKRLQEQQKANEAEAEQQVSRLGAALDDLDARLKAIDSELSSQITYPVQTTTIGSAAWAPPDPLYGGFTGWVENIGRVGGAPASFRLTKGGEIRFYLRSDRYSLNDFVGRRVWVNGNIELAAGAVANVLNADQIRVLTDTEIAQGMQAPPPAGVTTGLTQAQVIEGYTPTVASDPYQIYYGQGAVTAPASAAPAGVVTITPGGAAPSDPGQLPDVVGVGVGSTTTSNYRSVPGFQNAPGPGVVIQGSAGEVDSDFYENPVISEIPPP